MLITGASKVNSVCGNDGSGLYSAPILICVNPVPAETGANSQGQEKVLRSRVWLIVYCCVQKQGFRVRFAEFESPILRKWLGNFSDCCQRRKD